MDIPSILLAIVVFLAATAICVILFERLGFGAIPGFIVAGIIRHQVFQLSKLAVRK